MHIFIAPSTITSLSREPQRLQSQMHDTKAVAGHHCITFMCREQIDTLLLLRDNKF